MGVVVMTAEPRRVRWCTDPECHLDRERKMVNAIDGIHCDPCIAPIVRALNQAGVPTVASCCGHGFCPGWIALKDGRQIMIARSLDEAKKMDKVAPMDINGTPIARAAGVGEP